MGVYALFGLLLRPLHIAMSLVTVAFFLAQIGSTANVLVLSSPAICGALLGRIVQELRHTLLSWTLPTLRRRLFSSLLFGGVVTAFIQTWIYTSAGGTAPWVPIFSSVVLWYSVGLILGANPILATMFRDIRRYGFVVFIWILMFAAMFTIDRIVELYNIQPVLCVLLGLLGASLCLYRYFDVNVARENALGPVTHTQGLKAESRRQWRRMGPFTGLFNWIRAGEYENFGFRRVGWPARAAFLPGIAVLGFAACVILLTDDMPGNVMRRQSLGFQRVANMFLTVGPAIYAVAYSINESLFLQKGWLYPQSRTQFARLAYWSGLLYGAVFFWIMLLAFLVRENLMPQYAGYDYIRPLTLILISIPFFQWLRVRYGPLFFQTSTGVVTICGLLGVLVLSWYSLKAAPHIPDVYEFVSFSGLILLSQFLFRYKVMAYFKTGDLV